MKQSIGVLLLTSSFLSASHGQQPIPPYGYPHQPIFVYAIQPQSAPQQFFLNASAQNNTTTQQNPITEITPTNIQKQEMVQQQETVQPHFLQNAHGQMKSLFDTVKEYANKNWLFCSITTACAFYTALVTYILYARYRIQNTHHWSNWQLHLTLEQLMQQTDTQLKVMLIKDIASYYINPQNPTDSLWPLTQFLIAVKEEERAINRYLSLTGIIQKTPFYRILPTLYHDQARDALTRLTFVYHLFASWSADITWDQLHKIH